jgi:3D (Asp-Asp-Asp) domain-containing protein
MFTKFTRSFTMGLGKVTAALLLIIGQTAAAAEIAPYFYTWGGGKVTSLVQGKQLAGLNQVTLAFALSGGGCSLDSAVDSMTNDIKSFMSSGGKVIVSFGGASGTYIETACTDENLLFSAIDGLIQRTGIQKLDFDIEGTQLSNTAATTRRTHVLARLQTKYPNLYVSFTLPVEPSGLTSGGVNLVKSTAAGGVRINIVNIMTMDYGSGTKNLGSVAIQSAQGTMNQLKAIYPTKTTAQLYAMIGITPMIGKNDDGTAFSLADASQVTSFVQANGIGLIAYWAFQRDQAQSSAGAGSLETFSGVIQSDFQFYKTFKLAEGGVAQPPTPTPTPTPTPVPTTTTMPPTTTTTTIPRVPAGTCSFPNWVQGKSYATGAIVKFTDGKLYIAEHANPGYSPVISTWYWDPYNCTSTTPTPTPVPTPVPTTTTLPAQSPGVWTACADEDGTCNFSGTKVVRYGANGIFVSKTLAGPAACTNAVFGDPLVGVRKHCEIGGSTTPTTPTTPAPTTTTVRAPVPTTTTLPASTGAMTGQKMTGVYITLYGYDDNDDGSGNYGVSVISNPIIHKGATEDLGTFDHPSTFATDVRVAAPGTKIYVPRLHKYFIMEDTCRECTADKNSGKNHVDLYIGENFLQGNPLISCEETLTKSSDTIIINPSNNWPVSAPKIFIGAKCNSVQFPVP